MNWVYNLDTATKPGSGTLICIFNSHRHNCKQGWVRVGGGVGGVLEVGTDRYSPPNNFPPCYVWYL